MSKESVKCIRDYKNFMINHRKKTEKGHTYTSFGPPKECGTFYINNDDYEEFIKLYSRVINKLDLYMIERTKEIGPLVIDIDWRFQSKYKNRQYKKRDIKN